MRITTNAIIRNYRSNLGASLSNLDSARTKVMTGRQFISAAENPGAALRSSTLYRKYARNQDYLSSVKDVQSFQDSQEDAAMQINDLASTLSKQYGLEALNGTNGSADIRKTYADAWRGAQESMLLSLNATYEGKFVFAGNDGQEAPFKLGPDKNGKQTLFYRGIDVNSTDPKDQALLEELSKEASYVDLGFGMTTDKNGKTDPSSAFNTSLPGINLVGYGQDDKGNPKNMVLLAGQIADTLETEPFDKAKYEELLNSFDKGRTDVLEQVTTLGTKTEFLETTKERLETNEINLATQIDSLVNVDMAGAITEFSWAQYAYNAALKVGTNILSPSFIDFMK
jgi:flagellar hook-associated protein 3 FlgL|nr:flagellin [uncultured Faecalimonas sp.]